ncbi:MAG: hypothetical protein KDJ65_35230 [Anaerolineae bacterium]|nr:hypothetical protein [Anaerolineae bacterium]
MKTVEDFLIDLSAMDIKLWMDNGHLRCNAPKGVITPELRAQIQTHKTEIINFSFR